MPPLWPGRVRGREGHRSWEGNGDGGMGMGGTGWGYGDGDTRMIGTGMMGMGHRDAGHRDAGYGKDTFREGLDLPSARTELGCNATFSWKPGTKRRSCHVCPGCSALTDL